MGGFGGVSAIVGILVVIPNAMCRIDQEGSANHDTNVATDGRDAKLFNVFTVVRFPNDPCEGSSSRNGTCYTEAECDNKGGTNAGSCAQGFGVCCVFVANCGASIAENCTYFESTGSEVGPCSLEVCPCSEGICQIRLDFTTFVITGPSTSTATVGKATFGIPTGEGKEYTYQTQCLTDTFTVAGTSGTGVSSPPTICGTNTGEHMYADMSDANCNSLDFALGGTGVDATIPTRSFSIKVTQIGCDSLLRAPQGCTQWFYGQSTSEVKTFNFDGKTSGNGLHLANQNQRICVRQERGSCKICWSTIVDSDFDVSGKNDAMMNSLGQLSKGATCCSYGSKGTKTMGYDCVMIPGAVQEDLTPLQSAAGGGKTIRASHFCGNEKGLGGTKKVGDAAKTVCTKQTPFSINFLSDSIEMQKEAAGGAEEAATAIKESSGFRLAYIMSGTNC